MNSARFDVRAAIEDSLPELDRRLRAHAIAAVAARARTLTAEELDDEATLAVALCRVASTSVKTLERFLPGPTAASAAPADDSALARRELEQQHYADQCDAALVALAAASRLVHALSETETQQREWLDTDTLLEVSLQLAQPGNERLVRERALALASATAGYLPIFERQLSVGVSGLRRIREYALGQGATGFVQLEALGLLVTLLGQDAVLPLQEVLSDTQGRDKMIVRHGALGHVLAARIDDETKLELLWRVRADDSEHVRQGLARSLRQLASPLAAARLAELVRDDASERVAAVALLELAELGTRDKNAALLLSEALVFALGAHPLLRRAALYVCSQRLGRDQSLPTEHNLRVALLELIERGPVELSERGALLARCWESRHEPEVARSSELLSKQLASMLEGGSRTLELPPDTPALAFERALCVHGALDLPIAVAYLAKGRVRLWRGERRLSRLWRLGHELTHPAPDKRQNYLHGRARSDTADAVTVPLLLAEVTPTSVPGERRTLLGQSWGGFLPRVDDVLFACERGHPRRLLTVFGTVVVTPPKSWFSRQRVRLYLNFRYRQLADARERALKANQPSERRAFAERLRSLGFELTWQQTNVAFGSESIDVRPSSVAAYYSLLPLPVTLWVEDAIQYVLMPTGNTAWHLALVVWALLTLMVLRSAWTLTHFERSRRAIPLSIGGWGSRGKSGTERLKAALFHAQHYDVVSKTTGCEAMIIVARRGQPAHEVFLYRPYDKATIWEQEKVVEYAQALGAQVFLWECMALQPEFVDILNREWMKDGITTITNAYPDHEDVMGPTGEDVARTIAQFVPDRGTVFCSEDQMRPIVMQSALRRGATMIDVDALEADLLPKDMLARFPYDEHPRNIALVLRLAEHLGVDRQRALVDVADNVFPDLGVLKTYPAIVHKSRTLRFSNGMSANERAGFLSNWKRLGLSEHQPDAEPERMLVAVVNNRADRVPRSRVFAELLAKDVTLDVIVIIGTNQEGMRGFLQEAIAERIADVQLSPRDVSTGEVVEALWDELGAPRQVETLVDRLGRVHGAIGGKTVLDWRASLLGLVSDTPTPEQLGEKLEAWTAHTAAAMIDGADTLHWSWSSNQPGQELARHLAMIVAGWHERNVLRGWLAGVTPSSRVEATISDLFVARFSSKVVVLEDSSSKGDQVIDFIAQQLPPGMTHELLGCQNIKGTGLDFVYRFTSIGRVADWLTALSEVPEERRNTLAQLRGHVDFGLFDATMALDYVTSILDGTEPSWAEHRPALEALQKQLSELAAQKRSRLGSKERRTPLSVLLGLVEPFVDHLDAIFRKQRALSTMNELIAGRLSQAQAVERLRDLTTRQKGGWLAKDASELLERIRGQRKRA